MTYLEEVGDPGTVAKIKLISDDGHLLHFALSGGATAWARCNEPTELEVNDVVLIYGNDRIEKVPDELWPEERSVGVVRLKLDDVTVIDQSGTRRVVPTNTRVDYDIGNTVEVSPTQGITRVLSEHPIGFLDSEEIGDRHIRQFIKDTKEDLAYEDFGGLREIVDRAKELIEAPLRHSEALSKIGARPIKGVLFTGAPGTGKTMLARIIASKADATFYQISGPEIISKWYGQSEQLLRKLFEHAASQTRAIVFFDEIDSVAAQRSEDAHEASRRIVAQLLTLMDGFSTQTKVVVIATTNRPQDIDSALRRPGRFDWEIKFPLPNKEDREAMLRASARNLETLGPVPFSLVSIRTESWSAAELAAIWSEAALLAVTDHRSAIMAEDVLGGLERVERQRQLMQEQPNGATPQ